MTAIRRPGARVPGRPRPAAVARRARTGTTVTFAAAGFFMSGWVVNIPPIMQRLGVDDALLGLLLLVLGGSALVMMQAGGAIAARHGSRLTVALGACASLAGIAAVALAPSVPLLAGALVLFGLGAGALDLGMNEQAVRIEKLYERPIMSAFHAFFSIGGAIGAACGALLLASGMPLVARMGLFGVAGFAAVVFGWTRALPGTAAPEARLLVEETPGEPAGPAPRPPRGATVRAGFILAFMAFSFFLAEGTVNDWAGRHAVTVLGRSDAEAALAFTVFSAAMTLMRFLIDRIAAAIGPGAVIGCGGLIAAAGMGLVTLSPTYAVVLTGWGLFGVGLSGIVPQLFTAAGSLVAGPRSAVVLSRVVGAGYVGLLAGPAAVGWLAGMVGLDKALFLPLVLALAGAALSLTLPGRRDGGTSRRRPGTASPAASGPGEHGGVDA